MLARVDGEFLADYSGNVRVLRGEHPTAKLIAYARAFLLMNRHSLQFYFGEGSQWQSISMERAPGVEGAERALVNVADAAFPSGMTKREVQILTLIAASLTNQQIADRFGTSPRTVSTQVERLMRKLAIRSRAGLAAVAVDGSLIALPVEGGMHDLVAVGAIGIQALAESLEQGKAPASLAVPTQVMPARTIKIGTIAGLHGYSLSDAVEHLRGIDLAIHTINSAGGVFGRQLQGITASADLSDSTSVKQAMMQLVENGVDAIASSHVSAENPFLLGMASEYGRPFLHLDAYEKHARLVADDAYTYGMIFQTCPTERTYSLAFRRFMRELTETYLPHHVERNLGIIEMDVPSAAVADEQALADAATHGWSVSLHERIPVSVDWTEIVRDLIDRNTSLLLVSHVGLDSVVALQRELVRAGYGGLVYYVYTASKPEFLKKLGPAAEGVFWSSSTILTDSAVAQRFRRDYALRYGTEPGPAQASAAFDQLQLLAWAWRQAGEVDPQDVARAMRSSMYRGLNGTYFFGGQSQTPLSYPDETNDPTLGLPLITAQIQSGKSVMLSPDIFGSMDDCKLPWTKTEPARVSTTH